MRWLRSLLLCVLMVACGAALISGRDGGIAPGSAGSILHNATVPVHCVTARGEVFFRTSAPVGLNQCIGNVFVPVLTALSGVSSFNGRLGVVTLTSGDVGTALGFTPENAANKNASNGYAGLTSGKVTGSQITEVLAASDLTNYASVSGSGTVALAATITTPATNEVLAWTGTNWINSSIATALGFTPENSANRNASNGYAGLTAGKVTGSQVSEVLAASDLTNYASVSGSGTAALAATITSPANNQVLSYKDGDWVNLAPASGGVAPFDSTHPDAHPASPNLADDEFDVGSSLDTAGTRHASAVAWVWANQGTGATAVYAQSNLIFNAGTQPGSGLVQIDAIQQAITGTFKVRAKLGPMFFGSTAQPGWAGLMVRQSSDGKWNTIRIQNSTTTQIAVSAQSVVSPAGWLAQPTNVLAVTIQPFPQYVYLEIEEDSTNRMYRFSLSGVEGSFVTVVTETKTTNVTTDRVGFIISIGGTLTASHAVCDWFRRLS